MNNDHGVDLFVGLDSKTNKQMDMIELIRNTKDGYYYLNGSKVFSFSGNIDDSTDPTKITAGADKNDATLIDYLKNNEYTIKKDSEEVVSKNGIKGKIYTLVNKDGDDTETIFIPDDAKNIFSFSSSSTEDANGDVHSSYYGITAARFQANKNVVKDGSAGKSTLFNAIAGEFIADTGTITLDGKDITFLPDFKRSKAIGRMFQDPLRGTAPHMTIEENLALAFLRASGHTSSFSRISRRDRALFAERLSELGLGLEDRMKQPVGLLSGGQRQALTLLMATLVTPKLLLLDEHTAALDPATADKVLELTKKIVAENHLTCLMITHNMHDALTLGNRTLMMDHGRIVLDIGGEERAHTTVDGLLNRFAENVGHALDNDRILLSKEK